MGGLINSSTNEVNQSGSSAGGDVVAGNKITTTKNVHVSVRRSQIEGWLDKLAEEQRNNVHVRDLVDALQYYFQPSPHDDVRGLEAKLDHSGRSEKKLNALRKKEAFSKLLTDWQAFPAAQEIIAYFLAKIDADFETIIVPLLGNTSNEEIDRLIGEKLVDPVLQEMGCGPFMLNHMNVGGMVYWLAEQCYVRWHA